MNEWNYCVCLKQKKITYSQNVTRKEIRLIKVIKFLRKKISYSSVWFNQMDVAPVFESVLYSKLFISYFICSRSTKLIIDWLNNTWVSLEEEYLVFISAIIFVSAIEVVTCQKIYDKMQCTKLVSFPHAHIVL